MKTFKNPKPKGEHWPLYFNMWKSRYPREQRHFWYLWKTAKQSGDWRVFQELADEFTAMSEGERSELLGNKYRLFQGSILDPMNCGPTGFFGRRPEPEVETEPEEDSGPRFGEEGFWEDFGRRYKAAEEREQRKPCRLACPSQPSIR